MNDLIQVDRLAWFDRDAVDLSRLQRLLTLKARQLGQSYSFTAGQVPLITTEVVEEGNRVGVPRAWWLAQGRESSRHFTDAPHTFLAPLFTLKPEQDAVVKQALQRLRTGPEAGGIIEGLPGSGKTIVLLALAARLGQTALVLVHSTAVQQQWIERIKEWLGVDAGRVRQKRADGPGAAGIAVGLAQSVSKDRYGELWKSAWGTVILDECDLFPTRVFRSILALFPARYRLAASATIDRRDGMSTLLEWHVGPVLGQMMTPDVIPMVYAPIWPHALAGDYRIKVSVGDWVEERTSYTALMQALTAASWRNRWLTGYVLRAYAKNRKVLVLAHHRDHLQVLHAMLRGLPEGSMGFFIGGEPARKLAAAARCPIIFGTYRMMGRAIDVPDIDVEILAQPVAEVRQAVGRILRAYPNKKTPIVVDPVDAAVDACRAMFYARARCYAAFGATGAWRATIDELKGGSRGQGEGDHERDRTRKSGKATHISAAVLPR